MYRTFAQHASRAARTQASRTTTSTQNLFGARFNSSTTTTGATTTTSARYQSTRTTTTTNTTTRTNTTTTTTSTSRSSQQQQQSRTTGGRQGEQQQQSGRNNQQHQGSRSRYSELFASQASRNAVALFSRYGSAGTLATLGMDMYLLNNFGNGEDDT